MITENTQDTQGTPSDGAINKNFTGRKLDKTTTDYNLEVTEPLYHHHNVVIIRTPRELDNPDLPHLDKVFNTLLTAIQELSESEFSPAGDISILETPTRLITQRLLYSTLMTHADIGNDLTRAGYYHDSFRSSTLFIKAPFHWDYCLGAKLHRLADKTYLTYQNLILIQIWEPTLNATYSIYPLVTRLRTQGLETLTVGMIHNLDTLSIPDYNTQSKTVLNCLNYMIVTAGMQRLAVPEPGEVDPQKPIKTHFFSPLGYEERHKVFLDDTQVR